MKQALVTGAASGIGLALVRQLADAGYSILGVDRDLPRVAQAAKEIPSATWLPLDLLSADTVNQIVAALGEKEVDLVVLNAGISVVGPFEKQDRAVIAEVVRLNLISPALITRELLARGKLGPRATIVFLSSLSTFVGYPGGAVYAGTKAGLASLSRSLRVALHRQGIRTLTVFPGPTRTEHARRYSPVGSPEERRMPPEVVARAILTAVMRGHRRCIPGWSNQAFAWAGFLFPWLTDWVMRKTLFERLGGE